jgi:hypothetical protein
VDKVFPRRLNRLRKQHLFHPIMGSTVRLCSPFSFVQGDPLNLLKGHRPELVEGQAHYKSAGNSFQGNSQEFDSPDLIPPSIIR